MQLYNNNSNNNNTNNNNIVIIIAITINGVSRRLFNVSPPMMSSRRVCNLSQTRKTLICSCFRMQLLMHRMISLSYYVLLLMPLSSMVTYQHNGYQAP